MQALCIHAGPRALKHLRERGLQPSEVWAVPGAAGGPKGLVLTALDRLLLGDWLLKANHPVHLIGSSVGAWRLALACLPDAPAMFNRWAHDYITQTYPHEPGKRPTQATITRIFQATLQAHLGQREAQVLAHPTYRLHVVTARGRHLLSREGAWGSKLTTPLGYAGAFAANVMHRRAMGGFIERVLFSDPRDALPVPTHDFRTRHVRLSADNLRPSILASCAVPFWLESVRNIPGAPAGAYWDGGITDYHLHLPYASMPEGLVLYPHFQSTVVPGWLDKALKHRHRATAWLDNLVLLSPSPEWVASLPGGKIPDRGDFKRLAADESERMRRWSRVVQESQRLAHEMAEHLQRGSIPAQPLR
jgi:hypothetical protein